MEFFKVYLKNFTLFANIFSNTIKLLSIVNYLEGKVVCHSYEYLHQNLQFLPLPNFKLLLARYKICILLIYHKLTVTGNTYKKVDKKFFLKLQEFFSYCIKAIYIRLNMSQMNNAITQFNNCWLSSLLFSKIE